MLAAQLTLSDCSTRTPRRVLRGLDHEQSGRVAAGDFTGVGAVRVPQSYLKATCPLAIVGPVGAGQAYLSASNAPNAGAPHPASLIFHTSGAQCRLSELPVKT